MAKTFNDLVCSRQRLDHLYVLDINSFLCNDEQLLRLYVLDERGISFSIVVFGYHQHVDVILCDSVDEAFKRLKREMRNVGRHTEVRRLDSKMFRIVCPKNSTMEKVVNVLRQMQSEGSLVDTCYYSNANNDFLTDAHSRNNWIHLSKDCISQTSEYMYESYAKGYVNFSDIQKCECCELLAYPKFSVMALYLDANSNSSKRNRRSFSTGDGCSLGITRIHRNGLSSTVFTTTTSTTTTTTDPRASSSTSTKAVSSSSQLTSSYFLEDDCSAKVRFLENDKLMASEVIRYIEAYDPDIIVGYDLVHILPFLKNRAETCDIVSDGEQSTSTIMTASISTTKTPEVNEELKYRYAFSNKPLNAIEGRCIVDLNILGKIFTSAGIKQSFENLCHDVLNTHAAALSRNSYETALNRSQLTMKLFQQTFFELLNKASIVNKIPIAKQFLREY